MRTLLTRTVVFLSVVLFPVFAFAANVTVSGTTSFASLDGGANDDDHAVNGVFTVNGDLTINGTVTCNDDDPNATTACAMRFVVGGNLLLASGSAVLAENRVKGGNGGDITFTVTGNTLMQGTSGTLAGALISSAKTNDGNPAKGGDITITTGGTFVQESRATISSAGKDSSAGAVTITSTGKATVGGYVFAGPSRAITATLFSDVILSGGSGRAAGGPVSIKSLSHVSPGMIVGNTAIIVSQGADGGGATVALEGCGIQVDGLVAALTRQLGGARVVLRSGTTINVDGTQLGSASVAHVGRIRADALRSDTLADDSITNHVDLFAAKAVTLSGPPATSTAFVVTSNAGNKNSAGTINVVSTSETVTATGNVFQAAGADKHESGGTINVSGKSNVALDGATIDASGGTNGAKRAGGHINVRSYSGAVSWIGGVGDVRPVGILSGVAAADQGTISLTYCTTLSTSGASFPTNGAPSGAFPATAQACAPAAPALPSGEVLPTCNLPPVANNGTATTNEDNAVVVTLTATDPDGDPITFSIVSGPAQGSLGALSSVTATSAQVTYTPNSNYNGSDAFSFKADDGQGGSAIGNVTITINPVNDPPSFVLGTSPVVSLEDAGPQSVAGYASSILAGPTADEASQSVTFTVTNDNNALFSVQPAIASNGTLTYTALANASGTAHLTVVAHDNGGIANGGVDSSAPQAFTISVTAVNDAPVFTKGPDVTVNSSAGPQTFANWATGISAGPNEGTQTVTFVVTNDNNAVFSAQPAVSSSGTLTFNTLASATPTTVHVSVTAHDDGGTANGGIDTSAAQTFNIVIIHENVAPVANADAYDAVGNTELAVGTAGTQAATLAVAGNLLTNDTDADGDTLTASLGTASAGASVTVNADGSFRYLPAVGFTGNDTFSYAVSDGNGGTANANVTIHVLKRVLYVKNNGGGANGRVDSPFSTLSAAQTAALANDTVYVFTGDGTSAGQSNGFVLSQNGQRLIGEGAALTAAGTYNGVANPQLRAAGTRPVIAKVSGDVVTIDPITNTAVSGIEIPSSTSNGVRINGATGVTMDSNKITSTVHNGVKGESVVGFTFTNNIVDASGSATDDSNVAFNTLTVGTENNLSGSVTITGNTLTNALYHGIDIRNFNGTISSLTISDNTITSSTSTATSKGTAVRIDALGSASGVASITKGTIANNTISNFPSNSGIQISGGNSNSGGPAGTYGVASDSSNVITISGNTIHGAGAAARMGANAIVLSVNGKGQGNFDVSNNGTAASPLTNVVGNAISLSAFGPVNVTATINNNVVVANNSFGSSGITVGLDKAFASTDNGSLAVTISNNSVSATDGNGIIAVVRNCTGSMQTKIQNNVVAAPATGVRPGIRVDSGTSTGNATLCLNISGNTSAGSGGSRGIGLRKQGTVSTVNAFGIDGMSATTSPAVEAYVDGLNPAGGGTQLLSATSGFTNCSLP